MKLFGARFMFVVVFSLLIQFLTRNCLFRFSFIFLVLLVTKHYLYYVVTLIMKLLYLYVLSLEISAISFSLKEFVNISYEVSLVTMNSFSFCLS